MGWLGAPVDATTRKRLRGALVTSRPERGAQVTCQEWLGKGTVEIRKTS